MSARGDVDIGLVLVTILIGGGLAWSAAVLLTPSPADLEQDRWAECVEAAREFGFDPPGGAEAWCVTTTRSGQ